jgi:alanyl-tRNA synthetase
VTERLYYTDPYLADFDATVVAIEPLVDRSDGKRGVVLDRTAFYPTSGGQPFDVGSLGGARVVDVIDRDDGSILHVVEGDIAQGTVHGSIEWARRFDHMQQHTGQHVLSAAFDRLFQVRTVSFHLGSAASTIDLSVEVTASDIGRAEAEANRIVWEDRPVSIRFAEATDAAGLPLRKESAREGQLRLIDVEGFDLSACGGTHVARTGAIGTIVVSGSERFRGGSRVEFLCGSRTLEGYRSLRESVGASTRLLSVLPAELPSAIERVQAEARDLRKLFKDLQLRLASHEAVRLADRAQAQGAARVVVEALEGWDANGLKVIASAIASRPNHVALLLGVPAPASIVIARAPDVALDAAAILKQLTARFGGKGGGRPELAQGGGLQGAPQDMIAAAREYVAIVE